MQRPWISARTISVLLGLAALGASLGAAQAQGGRERVRCAINDAPDNLCVFVDQLRAPGVHRMTFLAGNRRVIFEGRSNSGWWTGTLNGRAAMGYERNRGNIVFSTTDLKTRFSWWYPTNAHGTY
ncbi:hypothetical protein G4G27_22240 [Sphingomonas sp. So64.6b]|uniref:hypothetical protein n=1 Tax=Sphingomonas sp. So64.6b TaxID=2997354 RepID=UPI00160167E4|nr:hypothetical protein [Sphingomonas sp. So64.6b]QNA86396.1 hypothetical protein G4G27_22240 [Sphingomonas sp. So64.6b]